jgi:hypothetical protein
VDVTVTVDPVLDVLEVEETVELLEELEELEEDELELLELELEVVVDVEELEVEVLAAGEYVKVVTAEADPSGDPQVAFTSYVPAYQYGFPPGVEMKENAPVTPFAGTSATSALLDVSFAGLIVITTPVLFPGAGVTVPFITIGCVPEYEGLAVFTVTV